MFLTTIHRFRLALAHFVGSLGGALTHDFCPRANRYVYWLKQPLVILAIAAGVSLAIGLLLAPQGYVVCGGLCAVIGLGTVWPWIGMAGIAGQLRFTRRRAREGEPVEAVLTVVNRLPWPVWGLVLERGFLPTGQNTGLLSAASDAEHVAIALARVPGWSRADFRWNFIPACRGDYPLGEPLLTTTFPFGLWKRVRPASVESRLIVWPRIVPLDSLPLDDGRCWTLGALSERRAGYEGDVIGTRPYRDGDLLRHVHWAQTARLGRTIVCERQASLTAEVRVVLDGNPAHHVGDGPDSSLEWLLRVGASVCHALQNHDARLEVQLNGRVIPTAPGIVGEQRLGDCLATFRTSPNEPAWSSDFTSRRRPAAETAPEIIVTTDLGLPGWLDLRPGDRRLIVLNTKPSSADDLSELSSSVWCSIDLTGDPLHQLRQQWERNCRHAWCAGQ